MRIFEVNDKGELFIDPELKQVKWIKPIWQRNGAGKVAGDADGRKKLYATKELLYIYFMCDYKSIFVQRFIDLNDRHREVTDQLELKDYKPDKLVEEALSKYRHYQETVSERTLKELKKTLEASVDTLQFLRETIEKKIAEMRKKNDDEKLAELVNLFTMTLDMGKELPKSIESLSKLEEKVKKEQMESEGNIRGGGSSGMYEDPR